MNALSCTGPLLEPERMAFLKSVARLYATNPFEPARQDLLKRALREDYVPEDGSLGALARTAERLAGPLAAALADPVHRLARGVVGTPEERGVYQGAALYGLSNNYGPLLQQIIDANEKEAPFFDDFAKTHRFLFGHPGFSVPEPGDLLALFYQARRTCYFAATKMGVAILRLAEEAGAPVPESLCVPSSETLVAEEGEEVAGGGRAESGLAGGRPSTTGSSPA